MKQSTSCAVYSFPKGFFNQASEFLFHFQIDMRDNGCNFINNKKYEISTIAVHSSYNLHFHSLALIFKCSGFQCSLHKEISSGCQQFISFLLCQLMSCLTKRNQSASIKVVTVTFVSLQCRHINF